MLRKSTRDQEFTAFARESQGRLFRQAYLLTGNRDAAEDLAQGTLVKMYVAWSRVDNPAAYANRTLLYAFFEEKRKHKREAAWSNATESVALPRDPTVAVTLSQALSELAPRMRAAVVLRYWEDLSVEQTADLLGCSPGTVKSSTAKGLQHLRDRFADRNLSDPAPHVSSRQWEGSLS
ncbi:MAG: SigE family RNA polymerase sigma factor [Nocardioides sp.]